MKDALTILIAIIALYVAYQQWRTNRYKVKMDLFEKRIQVYEVIRQSLIDMLKHVDISKTNHEELKKAVRYSKFLFDDTIKDFIQDLDDKYWEITKLHDKLNRREGNEEWEEISKRKDEIWNSITFSLEHLEEIFSENMKLSKI